MDRISVIVPETPFSPSIPGAQRCLCALDVDKLMEWWPGVPHSPHRNPEKVRTIQRSLDWKRVAQIAAYLLQEELKDVPDLINKHFKSIYEPKKLEPGREWPPQVKKNIGFAQSNFPDFSNILIHINGATLNTENEPKGAANLVIDPKNKKLNFTVIDGQHRINGAYLALCVRRESKPGAKYQMPATIYLDIDRPDAPPKNQAQIFIDVNYYQKKVDSSLVFDLFPTARDKSPITERERAQDIGRKLMLETGPLVGMIQIPGIRYGTKNVVTLATLVGAVERSIPHLENCKIIGIQAQTEFIAHLLGAWLTASGRQEKPSNSDELDTQNVVYQGRILVSVLTLIPAVMAHLKTEGIRDIASQTSHSAIVSWAKSVMTRAELVRNDKFIDRAQFKHMGFHGAGGIARFRDLLWAATNPKFKRHGLEFESIARLAATQRSLFSSQN